MQKPQAATQQSATRRRGHRKSRKGCASCKWRHIKCDEFQPSCRNCLDHGRICDYLSDPVTHTVLVEEAKPWFIDCPPRIQNECEKWRKTGQPPFPILHLPSNPRWKTYSTNEMRHLHHMCLVSASFEASGTAGMSLWGYYLPAFLRLAGSFDHVAYAIMALSANNLGWMTKSTEAYQAACTYQNLAIQGVRQGITNFSKDNADAVLASSILLSVQIHEWRSWGSLMEGVRAVVSAMNSFKTSSEFSRIITVEYFDELENSEIIKSAKLNLRAEERPRIKANPISDGGNKLVDPDFDLILEKSARALETFTTCSKGSQEPTSIVDITKKDIVVLITLAYFFAVAIAVAPLFSVINQDFYLNIRAQNILEIDRMLQANPRFVCGYCKEVHDAREMMKYPREVVGRYLVAKMESVSLGGDEDEEGEKEEKGMRHGGSRQ